MSEKIGGAKGTELDDDFVLMEKVCAVWLANKAVIDIRLHAVLALTPSGPVCVYAVMSYLLCCPLLNHL